MKRKLNFDMMPAGCWKCNLHELLSKKAWDIIRKEVYSRSGGKCSICGNVTNKLDAHEVWSFDISKGVQKLEDIIAVCKDCHSVIHIGRTQLVGNVERAENHYMKVNGCTYAEMRADLNAANKLNEKRNEVSEWKLDVSFLKKFADN